MADPLPVTIQTETNSSSQNTAVSDSANVIDISIHDREIQRTPTNPPPVLSSESSHLISCWNEVILALGMNTFSVLGRIKD
jgi:hypothetical protein